MTWDEVMLDHLCLLIEWDRDYAKEAIQWYLQTCPWLKETIGPALRERWRVTAPLPNGTPSSPR